MARVSGNAIRRLRPTFDIESLQSSLCSVSLSRRPVEKSQTSVVDRRTASSWDFCTALVHPQLEAVTSSKDNSSPPWSRQAGFSCDGQHCRSARSGQPLALHLLLFGLRGERMPKYISAEATNGNVVPS